MDVKVVRAGHQPRHDAAIHPSYKQTEVGMIPDDWEVRALGQVCWVNQGLQIAINMRLKNPTPSAKPYITIQFLNDRKEIEYIDDYPSSACCTKEDVLMTRTGNTGIVVSGVEGVFHNNFFKINFDKKILNKDFLIGFFGLNSTKKLILTKAGTSTIPDLNHGDFYSILLPIPPLSEQLAISKALLDTDALIKSMEQFIAKKRLVKRGAMQELLTSKKRLRGFSGEWKMKRLGEVLTICHGKSQREVEVTNGPYPILATGGQIGTAKNYLYDRPSVLIGRKGTIDQPQYMETPFWTVDTLFYSVIRELNNAKFLFYSFCLIDWKQHNEASGVPSLNARTIERIEISIPEQEEQTAIAAILSDMDAEIAALEEKLAKAQQVKQGMMQELLTGRIRLV